MPTYIFERDTSTEEEWLVVNDDGTLTHERHRSGFAVTRKGLGGTQKQYTADEAKAQWPHYAAKIDEALRGD